MADFAEEIEQSLETKLGKIVSATKNDTAPTDHSFDMFDNSFIEGSNEGHISSKAICKKLLYISICQGSEVKAWDVLLLLPSLAFTLFLAIRWSMRKRPENPIFHGLVALITAAGLFRAALAMMPAFHAELEDKLTWALTLALMNMAELVVIGLSLGYYSKRIVIIVSALCAMLMLISMSILESEFPDPAFAVHDTSSTFQLFGHGGSAFCMATSAVAAILYAITILWANVVAKPNFRYYCAFLMIIHLLKAIGAGLVLFGAHPNGLCFMNLSTFLQVSLLGPLIYLAFLSEKSTGNNGFSFTYKAQVDDEEDDVSQRDFIQVEPIVLNSARPLFDVSTNDDNLVVVQ